MSQADPALARFICYELAPVAKYDGGTCEAQPSMEEARLQSDCTFWSLYGMTPDRETICIGDFCDYGFGAEVYTRITGCIVPENPVALRMLNLPPGH